MSELMDKLKEAAGGAVGLARELGDLTPQAISQWRQVPAGRVLRVSEITGIPPHEIRPDIYRAPSPEGAE